MCLILIKGSKKPTVQYISQGLGIKSRQHFNTDLCHFEDVGILSNFQQFKMWPQRIANGTNYYLGRETPLKAILQRKDQQKQAEAIRSYFEIISYF